MLKVTNQPRFSISLSSTALMIALLTSLGACATLDPSQRSAMSPATRSASAARPSESFFGYREDPADHPTGPSFFGYRKDPADQPTGHSFFGYREDPADQPRGPSYFKYFEDSVARTAKAPQPSRQPQTPVAVKR